MYSAVRQVFFTVSALSVVTGISKPDIRIIARDPYCEALSLKDDGSILLTESAVDRYFARQSQEPVSGFTSIEPDWDWQLPRQKNMTIPEIAVFFGISRVTAYALTKYPGFPVVVAGKHVYIPTTELKDWLNYRAARFHHLVKKGKR